jgi:hypothetical protein
MAKIPPAKPPSGKIPTPSKPGHSGLSFSFKHFRNRDPFQIENGGDGYPLALLERLKAVCAMSALEMKVSRSPALRCHPIAWGETTQPDGFDHLNAFMREQTEPYQFEVSVNEHGRVHGFFIDDVFYIVWLDPEHALYPKKN